MRPLSPAVASALLLVAFSSVALAQIDSALQFDGTNDYLVVADPLLGAEAFTIEAWVKANDSSGGRRIVANRTGSTADGVDLDINVNGEERELRVAINGGQMVAVDFTPHFGQWTHVAATMPATGGPLLLYVNGAQAADRKTPFDLGASDGDFRIGMMNSSGSHFDGAIDEVRVYNAVVPPGVIAAYRTQEIDASHPHWGDLVGYWKFSEMSGQVAASQVNSPAADAQLGSQVGVDAGDPTWTSDAAPLPVEPRTFGGLKARYRAR